MKTTFVGVLVIIAILLILGGLAYNAKYELKNPKTVTIEGCEYFKLGVRYSRALTHKGNCSNPIHYKTKAE